MTKFTYNNAKNASIDYMSFELNYDYYSHMIFEEDIDFCSVSKTANKLTAKLLELLTIFRENIHHT